MTHYVPSFFMKFQRFRPSVELTETDPCGPDKPAVIDDSPFGEITSPVENGGYPHDADCQWRITVDAGFIVRLTFPEFAVEDGYDANEIDFLAILQLLF